MTPPLSYLEFHALFILPPIFLLGWLAHRRSGAWWGRRPLSGLGIILVLAVVYTTPWDNLLIDVGVWWYGDGAVVETIWHAPVEEYLFFVLQPILTALFLFLFPTGEDLSLRIPSSHRFVGAVGGLGLGAVGWFLLGSSSTFYMGAILLWAGPILAIQWAFGLTYLWRVRRRVALAILVPSVYLWIVDRIAIGMGIWVISEEYTTGYTLFGLPIEEATFFLVTNIFVVQGIVLYMWLLDRASDVPALAGALERTPVAFDAR
ncbi:Lycopene cyclase family protein [Halalkaliarchaeum sp. AArc-CO]|uniref:lycopene cyclase domain-containing protein n=1 Tax=Halalkaliarchaeum sp. AArc-CO TaxID=2866381 RepID=UPI00217EDD49|nr:lycopene cyclase domain-containing protein [Halalkaliarchaeum sp. AArc-CO]UWG50551.1 Lycopene cyclase family protein [Halalkaliarchaeum sp. AArc-CO]